MIRLKTNVLMRQLLDVDDGQFRRAVALIEGRAV
jgi:hypothetical protein